MILVIEEDGVITVPEEHWAELGIAPGDEIDFEILPDGRVTMFKVNKTPSPET